jgi:hypothetical protein
VALLVILECASLLALSATGFAMDRYVDVHDRIKDGPKMELVTATFFGGAGAEEFVGAALASDGRVVAIGNSWGPPFPEHPGTRVLGADQLWNLPLLPVPGETLGRNASGSRPAADHPNRTGFLVFYSADLTRIEQVVRLGWGSASITAVRRLRDGSIVIAGRANRSLDAIPCPATGRRRQAADQTLAFRPYAFAGVSLPGDVYVAKLTPDLAGFAWVWTLEGMGEAPTRLYEGKNEVLFKARGNLWRVAANGSAVRDYSGTPLGKVATRLRGISPTDGRVIIGGTWLISTGREPWKQPWMDVYDSDGNHIESYYWWSGGLVGHDDFRLVSDSSLERVEPLANGSYLLTGGSDGGNSVFCRHPADLTKEPKHSGLPMSTWGAGAGHWSHFVRFNPYDLNDVSYTLWSAYRPGGPESIYVHDLRGLADGSLVIMGYASPYLVQHTNRWFRANSHYFRDKDNPAASWLPNGWPKFQGLGGYGNYVAVLNPELDSLLWSSVFANCEPADAVACETGLIVAGRATGLNAFDGRTPALLGFDLADWPGFIAKLVAGQTGPARQVWKFLSEPLRAALKALPATTPPPAELQNQLRDELDELLFDQRAFYEPSAWPDAAFDSYEQELLAKLKAGPITDEELGYFNRSLLELGFPTHVFARPKHNLTPLVRAAQPQYGGGPLDGHIYLLKTPTGRRLDQPSAPKPVQVAAAPKPADTAAAAPAAKGPVRENLAALGGVLDLQFAPAKRRALQLPGYCTTYVILRNPEKLKPLFLHGWGETGALAVNFSNDGGLADKISIRTDGTGTLLLDRLNTKPAADWNRFAGGEWLRGTNNASPLRVTLTALRNWQAQDNLLMKFLDPARGLLKPEQLALLTPRFRVQADVTLSAGQHEAKLPDIPATVTLKDAGTRWLTRVEFNTQFAPAALGLTEEGKGPVTLQFVHEAFSLLPQANKAPSLMEP